MRYFPLRFKAAMKGVLSLICWESSKLRDALQKRWKSCMQRVANLPTLCKSSMRYFPLGFKSAMKGVLSLILWKSSRLNGTPAALDIASKCSTALVLPPRAITVVMPFSKALAVMMSRGFMSRFNSSSSALQHSCCCQYKLLEWLKSTT